MKPEKTCQSCGRVITWRKKWEACWEEIRYCSTRCRRAKPKDADRKLEETILELLDKRASNATICPSEAARLFFPAEVWREQMERTRQAARRLVDRGELEILQKGRIVDPSRATGPIRLRRKDDSFRGDRSK